MIVGSNEKTLGKFRMNAKIIVKLNEDAKAVARFWANSDRVNLNCNRNPQNSKSKKDWITGLGITRSSRANL